MYCNILKNTRFSSSILGHYSENDLTSHISTGTGGKTNIASHSKRFVDFDYLVLVIENPFTFSSREQEKGKNTPQNYCARLMLGKKTNNQEGK